MSDRPSCGAQMEEIERQAAAPRREAGRIMCAPESALHAEQSPDSMPAVAVGIAAESVSARTFPALRRAFQMVFCDWDGTVVDDCREGARTLAQLAEPLLTSGLWLVIVTDMSFEPIARQFCELVTPQCRRHLLVCAHGGNEVFGFDEQGLAMLRLRHIDAPGEDRARTAIADAVNWIQREVMEPSAIMPDAVLVVGAAFGNRAGAPASTARLHFVLGQAIAVSVGIESEIPLPGIIHLGGGARAFRALLAHQLTLRCADVGDGNGKPLPSTLASDERLASILGLGTTAAAAPEWEVTVHGIRPELEHVVESWLTVGNGFLGVRGALDDPHPSSRPRTLVAGLYGPVDVPGRIPSQTPGLVAAPNWTPVRLIVDGELVALGQPEHPDGEPTRVLDMQRAVLRSRWAASTKASGPITVESVRLVSQVRRHIGLQILRVTVSQPATVVLQSWLDPSASGLTQLRHSERRPAAGTVWHTQDKRWWLGCATRSGVSAGDGQLVDAVHEEGTTELERRTWAWDAEPGRTVTIIRIVALARERRPACALHDALKHLDEARAAGVDVLLDEHIRAWHQLWGASAIRIDGDPKAQRYLRFALYHLLSAGNPDDGQVSIGARGLTGEGYLGHVFWDTDVYVVPFFAFTRPAAARALLMYRYHTLPAARERAAQLGYAGALYAWESADSGADVTPTGAMTPNGQPVAIATGTEEQHISADIAYAVWQYWHVTRDVPFLLTAGAEILLETARFWASRCALEPDGLYHIRHVIGPDEYHEGVDDNAYTNRMAQQNLIYALNVARLLARRWPRRWHALTQRLELAPGELDRWRVIGAHLAAAARLPLHQQVIEQFAGYFGLEPIDLGAYGDRAIPMDVILGAERTRGSQVIKQADVLMLLALLPDQYTPRETAANYHYYEPRCGHGSSLSPGIHALVAARLGKGAAAMRYFRQTGSTDLNDTTGAAAQGLHMAAFGGLWLAVVYGFAGVLPRSGSLRLDPHLPDGWASLETPLEWRGRTFAYRVDRNPLRVSVRLGDGAAPVMVAVGSLHHRLCRGSERWDCWWDPGMQAWKEGSA